MEPLLWVSVLLKALGAPSFSHGGHTEKKGAEGLTLASGAYITVGEWTVRWNREHNMMKRTWLNQQMFLISTFGMGLC